VPTPPFIARDPRHLADRRSGPDANRSLGNRGARRIARLRRIGGAGPHRRCAGIAKVEDDGGRDDRHDEVGAHREPPLAREEPLHHAVGRAQSERGAARQEEGVDVTDDVAWVERVDFPRAGGTTAQRRRRPHAAGRREHHRAPGGTRRMSPVSYANSGNGGEARSGCTGGHAAKIVALAGVVEVK
jgi:hypothetical protein